MTDSPDMDLLVTAADNLDQIAPPAAKEVRAVRSIRSAWQRVSRAKIGLFEWQRFLLDNLAHQIVVQTDRPVLVV